MEAIVVLFARQEVHHISGALPGEAHDGNYDSAQGETWMLSLRVRCARRGEEPRRLAQEFQLRLRGRTP